MGKIRGSDSQDPRRFLQHANREVARVTQDASNCASSMIVVEMRSLGRAGTDSADAALRGQNGVELGGGDAVVAFPSVSSLALATGRTVVPLRDTRAAFATCVSAKRWSGDPVSMAASACFTEFPRFTLDERVAMALPAVMVHTAPAPTKNVSVAVIDRALPGRTLSLHQGAKTSLVWSAVVSSGCRLHFTVRRG